MSEIKHLEYYSPGKHCILPHEWWEQKKTDGSAVIGQGFLFGEWAFVSWHAELWTCFRKSCVNLIIWQPTIWPRHSTAQHCTATALPHTCHPSVLPWPSWAGRVGVSVCSSAFFQASSSPSWSRNIPNPLCFRGNGTTEAYSWTSSLKDWRKEGRKRDDWWLKIISEF